MSSNHRSSGNLKRNLNDAAEENADETETPRASKRQDLRNGTTSQTTADLGFSLFMWGRTGDDDAHGSTRIDGSGCGGAGGDGLPHEDGSGETENEPVYLEALHGESVQQIACGETGESAYILTTQGTLKQWGPSKERGGWDSIPHRLRSAVETPVMAAVDDTTRTTATLVGSISLRQQHQTLPAMSQLVSGYYHFAAISKDGDLFTWGSGSNGKLGHGTEDDVPLPKRVEALAGIPIKQVACAYSHTLALTSNGIVYEWGDYINSPLPQKVQGFVINSQLQQEQPIAQISTFGSHMAAVTVDGVLFTWGLGTHGRLGHGDTERCVEPKLVEALRGQTVQQVSCGGFHTAVLTQRGTMFSWGCNDHGQLGHNSRETCLEPQVITALVATRVTKIACGYESSVAVTNTGEVLTWGTAEQGAHGHGSNEGGTTADHDVLAPQKVQDLKSHLIVEDVACFGYNYTTAMVKKSSSGGLTLRSDAISIATALHKAINDEEFSDVTFLLEGNRPIHAHRVILTGKCEFFATMFRAGMRESSSTENGPPIIPIPNVRYDIFLLVLNYLYTDKVHVHVDDAVELCSLAEMYGLDRLQKICCTAVKQKLTAGKTAAVLQLATVCHCHVIKEICMKFVMQNFIEFSKSDGINQLSQGNFVEIVQSYGKYLEQERTSTSSRSTLTSS
eukprot:CAMPEP_0172461150 /NCGR_PEP_ID=MMETSP1065-20121228/39564_1 /TAXON_ID=265537 /ORGANISM="Amphiprora paludosa, Strain CCMP125" /LENGTH=675 /DNA_ID=CAMNT_0013216385 /DNA_START=12 /DNA_END=2039 /DNA_ORIENTATION=-